MNRKLVKSALLALMAAVVLLSAACGAKMSNSVAPGSATGEAGYADGSVSYDEDSAPQSTSPDRKEILTVHLVVETRDYKKTIETVKSSLAKYGGYVQSSSESGASYSSKNARKSARFEIRVPSENVESFLADSESFGNIISNRREVEDVTDRYFDSEARLKTLQVQEQRYLELLQKADKMEDILALEKALADVRYQIENLTGTLRRYDSLIAYSTVTIEIREVADFTEKTDLPKNLGEKLANAFSASLKALKVTFEYLLIVLVAILPFLVIILAIAAVAYNVARLVKSKRNKN